MSFPAAAVSVPPPAKMRRWVSLLAVGYGILVVYGSLLPFAFTPVPPAEAWQRMLAIPYLTLGAGSRADWVANILLFVPLAFLWCARAGLKPTPRTGSAIAVLLACLAFAVVLEFAQLWFPPRTVSRNDIIAEAIGSAIGVAVWVLWGRRLVAAGQNIAIGGATGLAAAVCAYGGAYVIFVLLPFDIILSPTELQAKLGGESVAPVLSPWCGGTLRCGLKLSIETASLIPIGFLFALVARHGRGRVPGMMTGAAIGALTGVVIELCQIFLVSGIAQGVSVLTRAIGVALGVLLGRHWNARWVMPWVRFGRPLLVLAAPVYGLLVAVLFWRGGWQPDDAVTRLQTLSWLPFYYHYYTSEQAALVSLLSNAALYAPIGAGIWLWRFAAGGGRRTDPPGAALAATLTGLLAVALEGSRLLKTAPHPDPTNILIAAIAALLAFRVTGWLAACLLSDRPGERLRVRR